MTSFLPSEIARLVLGYLDRENCRNAYRAFLHESVHLRELALHEGHGSQSQLITQPGGKGLPEILDDYGSLWQHFQKETTRPQQVSVLWDMLDRRHGQCVSEPSPFIGTNNPKVFQSKRASCGHCGHKSPAHTSQLWTELYRQTGTAPVCTSSPHFRSPMCSQSCVCHRQDDTHYGGLAAVDSDGDLSDIPSSPGSHMGEESSPSTHGGCAGSHNSSGYQSGSRKHPTRCSRGHTTNSLEPSPVHGDGSREYPAWDTTPRPPRHKCRVCYHPYSSHSKSKNGGKGAKGKGKSSSGFGKASKKSHICTCKSQLEEEADIEAVSTSSIDCVQTSRARVSDEALASLRQAITASSIGQPSTSNEVSRGFAVQQQDDNQIDNVHNKKSAPHQGEKLVTVDAKRAIIDAGTQSIDVGSARSDTGMASNEIEKVSVDVETPNVKTTTSDASCNVERAPTLEVLDTTNTKTSTNSQHQTVETSQSSNADSSHTVHHSDMDLSSFVEHDMEHEDSHHASRMEDERGSMSTPPLYTCHQPSNNQVVPVTSGLPVSTPKKGESHSCSSSTMGFTPTSTPRKSSSLHGDHLRSPRRKSQVPKRRSLEYTRASSENAALDFGLSFIDQLIQNKSFAERLAENINSVKLSASQYVGSEDSRSNSHIPNPWQRSADSRDGASQDKTEAPATDPAVTSRAFPVSSVSNSTISTNGSCLPGTSQVTDGAVSLSDCVTATSSTDGQQTTCTSNSVHQHHESTFDYAELDKILGDSQTDAIIARMQSTTNFDSLLHLFGNALDTSDVNSSEPVRRSSPTPALNFSSHFAAQASASENGSASTSLAPSNAINSTSAQNAAPAANDSVIEIRFPEMDGVGAHTEIVRMTSKPPTVTNEDSMLVISLNSVEKDGDNNDINVQNVDENGGDIQNDAVMQNHDGQCQNGNAPHHRHVHGDDMAHDQNGNNNASAHCNNPPSVGFLPAGLSNPPSVMSHHIHSNPPSVSNQHAHMGVSNPPSVSSHVAMRISNPTSVSSHLPPTSPYNMHSVSIHEQVMNPPNLSSSRSPSAFSNPPTVRSQQGNDIHEQDNFVNPPTPSHRPPSVFSNPPSVPSHPEGRSDMVTSQPLTPLSSIGSPQVHAGTPPPPESISGDVTIPEGISKKDPNKKCSKKKKVPTATLR